ncbi:MAG: vWA domain-containing protein, partial [Leeuwenhoekiella sp.]
MATNTILLIILAGIISLGIALFQYVYKSKNRQKAAIISCFCRFFSVFALLLLLINPKFTNVSYYTVKPVLAIAVDNSASIENLGFSDQVKKSVSRFRESKDLQERFDLNFFSFGNEIAPLDSLNFNEDQTNISGVFKSFKEIYKSKVIAPLLITDGNATVGEEYTYTAKSYDKPIYILAAGDTVVYDDLKIDRINVNRYAYLKNEFPVEVISSYTGAQTLKSQLEVKDGNTIVYREPVTFDSQNKSHIFNFFLPASSVGVHQYSVYLTPGINEKNKINNQKNFATEVIDQKTNVLILYSVLHPDLGALKKSIESNSLRTVTIKELP